MRIRNAASKEAPAGGKVGLVEIFSWVVIVSQKQSAGLEF
jgi:hypothetical protein